MKIDEKTVEQVAKLAKLKINESDLSHFAGQLTRILDYADQLGNTNTKIAVEISKHKSFFTPERPDNIASTECLEDLLASAPALQGTAFKVPKIID